MTRRYSWQLLAAVRRLLDDGPAWAFPRLERLESYLVARIQREGW